MIDITGLVAGLEILRNHLKNAPIVTQAYYVCVPTVPAIDIIDPAELAVFEQYGWAIHPLYGCYLYPCATITEVKSLTGSNVPSFPAPVVIPPVI